VSISTGVLNCSSLLFVDTKESQVLQTFDCDAVQCI